VWRNGDAGGARRLLDSRSGLSSPGLDILPQLPDPFGDGGITVIGK
jgi:hypothetical protein